MKRLLVAAALAALSSPAPAYDDGIRITTDYGRIRSGAPCTLYVQGLQASGHCVVARGYGGRNTLIVAGDQQYQIRRDGRESARFYRTTGNMNSLIGDVYASGSCWVGSSVRFCAD